MKRVTLAIVGVLTAALLGSSASFATDVDLDNFHISDFAITYQLSRDAQGHSTLRVTEQITAEFPDWDQNRGIIREIPGQYDGHSVDFELISLSRNGEHELPYDETTRGDFHVISTGTDDYLRGTQVYEFVYTLRDVTRYFENTDRQEFYWDTNGTAWRVPIEALSITLEVEEPLRSTLTGNTACYQGRQGSGTGCEIERTDTGYAVAVNDLARRENVTIAIGFESDTFTEYQPTLLERILPYWIILTVVTTIIAIGVIGWLSWRAHQWRYRTSELKPIAPEYLPPKQASVPVSAAITPGYYSTLAAELTDLAVRHYIQIIETRAKSTWRQAEYTIKVIRDVSSLRQEEREILSDLFGTLPKVNDELALKTLKNNTKVARRFEDNDGKLTALIRAKYNLKAKDEQKRAWFMRAAKVLTVLGIVTLSPGFLAAAITAASLGATLWVLSDEGLALRRYLEGLKLYISVAEKERLRMLQSPEGAAKVPIKGTNDPAQLVKLYEKVLPYAILFRQEKEWSKRIGDYYVATHTSPDWYSGTSTFNALAFGSMINNFSSSVSAATASSSSSSYGGSGGGGGGGGGGGR